MSWYHKELDLEKKVQCKQCCKTFCTEEDLLRHDKSKHNREPVSCKTCDKKFPKNSDLEFHLETEHEIPKTFKCDKCDMAFMLTWRLNKHMSIHE